MSPRSFPKRKPDPRERRKSSLSTPGLHNRCMKPLKSLFSLVSRCALLVALPPRARDPPLCILPRGFSSKKRDCLQSTFPLVSFAAARAGVTQRSPSLGLKFGLQGLFPLCHHFFISATGYDASSSIASLFTSRTYQIEGSFLWAILFY